MFFEEEKITGPSLVVRAGVLIGCYQGTGDYSLPYMVGNFDPLTTNYHKGSIPNTSPDKEYYDYLHGQMQRHVQSIVAVGSLLWGIKNHSNDQKTLETKKERAVSCLVKLGIPEYLSSQIIGASLQRGEYHLVGDLEYYKVIPDIEGSSQYDVRLTNFKVLSPNEDRRHGYNLQGAI